MEPTSTVSLHSNEIYIKNCLFTVAGASNAVEAKIISFDLKLTTVSFTFSDMLPMGKGILKISFQCALNNQMSGFYRSGYKTVDGEAGIMASTQFEALDARRCFPCWDEPARKAMTVVIPKDRMAFSNMPERAVTHLPGGKSKGIEF
ncbi:unnamed protein product, partial [Choristocarpus tenellus]